MREGLVNLALIALLPLVALGALAAGEPYLVTLAAKAAILALAGVGLNLALGVGGMVSLGHAAFFGIGGYAAGIAAHHVFAGTPVIGWPVVIAGTDQMPLIWLAGVLAAGLAAAAIGAVSLRTQGVHFIMITLAFAQMVYYLGVSWKTYGGEDGLPIYLRNQFPGLDTGDGVQFFALAYACLLAGVALVWQVARSRFGQALAMARMNEARLAASGISPYPVRLVGFVLSGMIVALAGALFADLNGFAGPSMLSWHRSGEIMVLVILGGVGRLCGPLAGAMLFVALETWLGGLTDRWQLFLGLVLLGVVLFARGGLMGMLAGRVRHG
ncbi:MAG: branched-chain amino acid ABC transporter permease [Thermohalobaculum sp.]|nr:branched-chain amino acid ABC transporter permease [Thermohalobaculum sp.]